MDTLTKKTKMTTPLTVCVVGLGLMGGSAALCWKAMPGVRVTGLVHSERSAQRVREAGLIDSVTTDPEVAFAEADLIVVCTPIPTMGAIFGAIDRSAKPEVIITDIASVRHPAGLAARAHLKKERLPYYVPLHPICGGELTGPEAARADLYEGAVGVLISSHWVEEQAKNTVVKFWEATGLKIIEMSESEHDRVYALVSHMPHLIAYATMLAAMDSEVGNMALKAAGSGFRDLTRIAGSDPSMWADIVLENREAVLSALSDFEKALAHMKEAVQTNDRSMLVAPLSRASVARRTLKDKLPPIHQ